SIEPGSTFWVGLRQRIAPGWHTYWINPGDSGEPPSIEWKLPEGFAAGPIVWPRPERLKVGPFVGFGYEREVVLPLQPPPPANLATGAPVTLGGHVSWLVCEKICIPEEADVALSLPVAAGPPAPSDTAPAVEHALRAVPTPSPWAASLSATPETVSIRIAAPDLAAERIAEAWFFPMHWGVIDHAAPQTVAVDRRGFTLRAARGQFPQGTASDVDGVLVIQERLDPRPATPAFRIGGGVGGGGTGGRLTLAAAVGLAIAGGLILNLMPCVLPVLSIKAIALLAHGHSSLSVVRRHGLAYTVGVLASFGALAAVLIALRAGGAGIGWGCPPPAP